jgi:hypothetical protein
MFVKLIDTAPALAVSEVLSNFSWPSASAVRLREPDAPLDVDGAAGVDVDELDVAGAAAVELEDDPELVDELPQPANASSAVPNTGRMAREIEFLGA